MIRQPRHASSWCRAAAWLLSALTACAPLEPPPNRPLPQPRLAAAEYAHSVHFATDEATLPESEARSLRTFLASLPSSSRLASRVVGHADQRAGPGYNHELSLRRAAAVADVLRGAGFEPVSVTTIGMGEAMATAPLGDTAGLARDR